MLVVVVVVFGVVLAVQAQRAHARLDAARDAVTRLRADLVEPDVPETTVDADAVAVAGPARAAADITDGTTWTIAAHLPFLGHAARSARGTSEAVRDLATDVLPDLTRAQVQLRTDHLAGRGGIEIAPLRAAAPLLARASARTDAILARERSLRPDTAVGTVDTARSQLLGQLASLSGELHDASDVAQVLPAMIGGNGTRRYFLAFESESEARALGGLPGAYAILQATGGKLTLAELGSDSAISGIDSHVDLGPAYDQEFTTGPTRIYQNSDVSASFPDAAKIWLGLWRTRTGESLDGALVIDPTALGALLDVTGGTHLADGTAITGSNVVDLTEREAYLRFGSDNIARKQFLLDVARAAENRLVDVGPQHAASLARAAATEIGQRRLLVYSAHPGEQAVLASQPIAGTVAPATGPDAVTGPYLMVALNNSAGGKLDYFLDRTVRWTATGCEAGRRTTTVTVTLRNDAPARLPTSVTGPGYADDGLPLDTNRTEVLFYVTAQAGLLDATVDGRVSPVTSDTASGRPVYTLATTTARGATTTVVVRLLEPAVAGPPTLVTQPLVRPQVSSVDVPAC